MNSPVWSAPQFNIAVGSVAETHSLAAAIAGILPGGSVLGLVGPLGAGKTEFVRGFARALGIVEEICSPTFVLEAQYPIPGRMRGIANFHHWDLYRISTSEFECEISDLAQDCSALTVVEWPEKVDWVERLLKFKVVISLPGFSVNSAGGQAEGDQRREFSIFAAGIEDLSEIRGPRISEIVKR